MEINDCSRHNQSSLINELIHGMELAKELKAHLGPEISSETKSMMVDKIVSSYEKAFLILKWSGSMEKPHQQRVVPSPAMPSSPISVIGNPPAKDCSVGFARQQDNKDSPKKRKMMATWTEKVKANSENGVEVPFDDGFSWRKYGQKNILGSRFPRSYYRCTYRNIQGCWAIKQVQRSDEDPSIFDITYKGNHTCTFATNPRSAPPSSRKQEPNRTHVPVMESHHESEILMSFQTGLNVEVQNLDNPDMPFSFSSTAVSASPSTLNNNYFHGSYSPSFVSPTTSESNYFTLSPYNMNASKGVQNQGHFESDIAEIISASASATNSPIISTDFSLDPLEFNSFFPFDNLGFCP